MTTTMPAIKAHLVWGEVMLKVSSHGFQTLLRTIVVEDRGRWVRPWHRPSQPRRIRRAVT
jgi:hypothetical protein